MNARAFDVRTTPHFERLLKKLAKGHPQEAAAVFADAIAILTVDPYNRSRQYPIKKLEGVAHGDGQYRVKLGRWRFRYDIWPDRQEVIFAFCGLRREDTY